MAAVGGVPGMRQREHALRGACVAQQDESYSEQGLAGQECVTFIR